MPTVAQTSASRSAVAITASHSLSRVEMLSIVVTPARARAIEHLRLLLDEPGIVEVAMAIDEHQAGSTQRGNTPCGGGKRKCRAASGLSRLAKSRASARLRELVEQRVGARRDRPADEDREPPHRLGGDVEDVSARAGSVLRSAHGACSAK